MSTTFGLNEINLKRNKIILFPTKRLFKKLITRQIFSNHITFFTLL